MKTVERGKFAWMAAAAFLLVLVFPASLVYGLPSGTQAVSANASVQAQPAPVVRGASTYACTDLSLTCEWPLNMYVPAGSLVLAGINMASAYGSEFSTWTGWHISSMCVGLRGAEDACLNFNLGGAADPYTSTYLASAVPQADIQGAYARLVIGCFGVLCAVVPPAVDVVIANIDGVSVSGYPYGPFYSSGSSNSMTVNVQGPFNPPQYGLFAVMIAAPKSTSVSIGSGQTEIGQICSTGLQEWVLNMCADLSYVTFASGSVTMTASFPTATVPKNDGIGVAFAVASSVQLTSQITVTSDPAGPGYVTVDGAQITTPRTYTWTVGSVHTLAANSPASCGAGCQEAWQSWSDGGAQTHTVTVPSSATTYAATFTTQPTTIPITLSSSPSGPGFVQVDGMSITTPQTFNWLAGSTHALSASSSTQLAGTTYTYESWSDSGAQTHTITVPSSPSTYTATFSSIPPPAGTVEVTITSAPAGSGMVKVDGVNVVTPQTFNWGPGNQHTVSAADAACGSGCELFWQSWSDGGDQNHTITVPSSPSTYTASYKVKYSLTVLTPSGSGQVSPMVGTYWYDNGTTVQVSATPDQGFALTQWVQDGSDAGNAQTISVVMNGPHTVQAVLGIRTGPGATPVIHVATNPPGVDLPTCTPTCSAGPPYAPVQSGTIVIVDAVQIPGMKFSGIVVVDASGAQVPILSVRASSATFTMPSSDAYVTVNYDLTAPAKPSGTLAVPAASTQVVAATSLAMLLLCVVLNARRRAKH